MGMVEDLNAAMHGITAHGLDVKCRQVLPKFFSGSYKVQGAGVSQARFYYLPDD